jgi:hypothetical protein
LHCYLLKDYLFLIYFNCVYDGASLKTNTLTAYERKSRMMYIYVCVYLRVCTCVGEHVRYFFLASCYRFSKQCLFY